MSAAEQWMIIKNNSSFLIRRKGVAFSCEPNNLKNTNSFKYNGLVHKKTVGIEEAANGKGVVMVTKSAKKCNKPAEMYTRITLNKHPRRTMRSIGRIIKNTKNRPALKKAAMRRATAFLKSQQQKQNPK